MIGTTQQRWAATTSSRRTGTAFGGIVRWHFRNEATAASSDPRAVLANGAEDQLPTLKYLAPAEGIKPSSSVLETAILSLN